MKWNTRSFKWISTYFLAREIHSVHKNNGKIKHLNVWLHKGFPSGSIRKESTSNAGDCLQCRDPGSIPGSGGSPGEGNSNSFQYSFLGNPMDRGVWQATVSPWGHKQSDMTEQLNYPHQHQHHKTSKSLHIIHLIITKTNDKLGNLPGLKNINVLIYGANL